MDQTKIAIGIMLHQGGDNTVYVFDLKHVSVDDRIGTLSILTSSRQPKSVDFVHGVIEPILHCIERQIDINNELSAVRRISDDARLGMNLLVELDELDECADPVVTIHSLLERSARHFRSTFSAVLLPAHKIQAVHPKPAAEDESRDRQLMGMLGSLMSKAKMHRKVTRSTVRRSHVVSTPIFDSKDEVIGIYVLAGKAAFTQDQIRLCRAIGAKINALRSAPAVSASDTWLWSVLLTIDTVLSQ